MNDLLTHEQLARQLRAIIARLREDVEARSDPVLEEIAQALEVLADLVTHSHDHTQDDRARIEKLEDAGP